MAGAYALYAMNVEDVIYWVRAHERRLWLALVVAFIVPFAVYTLLCMIVGSDFLGMNVRSLEGMLSGKAITPHVYRQMVPIMAHALMSLSPESLVAAVTEYMHGWLYTPGSLFAKAVSFRHSVVPPELADKNLYAFVVVNLMGYAFLMGYVYYVWVLARAFFPQLFSAQVIAPLLAILAIPPLCARFAYIYDFPVLFFSAWLTHVLHSRRLVLYTAMVGVATLNKETTFYFIGLFMLWGWTQLPRRQYLLHLMWQCALFVAVKAAVTLYYRGNPGEFIWTRGFYDHIITNLDGYSVYTFLGLMVAVALLGFRFYAQPLLLRCWIVMLPFCVMSWMVFGMRNEYRVMYELFPALVLMASHTL
ncbi:MAG: hypothetical protein K2Q01_03475, partial [Rickettsiales bacterium]|nr:hypothetical protein [Rickettsiales bacterium]